MTTRGVRITVFSKGVNSPPIIAQVRIPHPLPLSRERARGVGHDSRRIYPFAHSYGRRGRG
jgi:hypothetical protein